MKVSKEGKLGYLAGLLDAEGSITLNNPYSKRHPRPIISPMILIGQDKGRIVMNLFVKEFGGSLHKGHYIYKGEKGVIHQYIAVGVAAQKIIIRLLPYLKIKKKHANLLLEIWKAKELGDIRQELKLAKQLATLNLKNSRGISSRTSKILKIEERDFLSRHRKPVKHPISKTIKEEKEYGR